MITPGQAARAILEHVQPLTMECLALPETLDRVLAQDARSPIDLPPWDNSAMDGYAVRSADVTGPGIELTVIESVPAGRFPSRPVGPGECSRIFTGAPLPEGADGVIRQEDVTALDARRIRINDARDAGRNVRKRAEDIARDTVVLPAGTPLGPAQLGVLASIGQSEVFVHRRPRVAILGSGDEIVDLDQRQAILSGRKIASSNTYTLLAMLARAHAEAVNLGIARDDPDDLRERLSNAFAVDLLVTSAGISVGEHDHMRTVLEQLEGDLKFWRIAMRPGAPVGFGLIGATPWIGLPGNPVSTMVTFELLVYPAIRKLLGYRRCFRRAVPVTVADAFQLKAPLAHFQRVRVTEEAGGLVARLTGPQGSGILTSMARADALLIVPAEVDDVREGMTLQAILLDDAVHVEAPPFA